MSALNNIFHFKCPCCEHKIKTITILGKINGCKSIKDKQCFYCPSCDRKIGKEHSTKRNFYLQLGLIIGIYYLVKYLGSYFDWAFYIYPFFYILFFYMSLVFFVNLYPFKCYEQEEKEIQREPFDKFYTPHENIRMDDFEKKTINTMASIPIIFIIIAFVVLISIAISSFFN